MAIFGETGLIKQPGARYAFERNGLATYDVQYKMSSGDAAILEQGNESDDYSNVVLMSGAIIHTGDATCSDVTLELHYEGKDTAHTRPEFTNELSLDITCSVEPIDSHPAFIKFAGTAASPQNGSTFDPKDGHFTGFRSEWPANSGMLNPFAGTRSYNCPVMVASQTQIQEEWPTEDEFKLLGKIIDSATLSDQIPNLSGDRNWLYTGIRIRSIGNVYYVVDRNAALSGPRQWNEDIYDPIKSEPS